MDDAGIFMCLEPKENAKSISYAVFILNTCLSPCIAEINISDSTGEEQTLQAVIQPNELQKIDHLSFDDLNDRPTYKLNCQLSTTAGLSKSCLASKKLNAKNVVTKKPSDINILNRKLIIYDLLSISDFDDTKNKFQLNTADKPQVAHNKLGHYASPEDRANFNSVLDLHIESLTKDPSQMSEDQIFNYQILEFEKWLDEIIRLGIEKSFVIHGLGKGKLRKAIHTILANSDFVRDFKNEYHPAYGNGATEINL